MHQRSCLSVILAAGEGTRMKSSRSKVLHEVAGLSLVGHVAGAAIAAGSTDIALVVGRDAELVKASVAAHGGTVETYEQTHRLGTAHAVLAASDAIARGYDDVLVLFGDTPLITADALALARVELAKGAAIAVMGFHAENPAGYGRLIVQDGKLVAIREDKDASEAERAITFCNGGIMAINGALALDLLRAVGNNNAKGEYYLTDIVGLAVARGAHVAALAVDAALLLGVNTRMELAEVERLWQQRRRAELMAAGVSMQSPETVWLSHDTQIAANVTLEPNIWFGPGVTVQSGAVIRAFSHIEGASIGEDAEIGPFARLRPGADLAQGAKVGNFCEVKKAKIGKGAKVNHLSYIGDADVGAKANIGAGTITCNYDGFNKFRTFIGEGAFIGSNSSLVAPITIGNGAYVASGSVVTEAVPDDALAFGRARQTNKDGAGKELRDRLAAQKAARQS
ncbi:MAG: bifunctional UDP-N-acetylglucosamine diphosphorylase/glucosamine-1-phosphate N-acetyltransferase GlmU [Phyllobacteriaceae bacterium]|nr:bifunctional UDP-N-acetylglucosamine diphosphorylase/glucosamine-1-phosphate N-acetyltransferase GlmU [Phyllobacteriaceae bacterium]